MSFEKLKVYQAAQLLDNEVNRLIGTLPRTGYGDDIRQLRRTVGSVLYNIPEAQGSEAPGTKRNHLSIARGASDEARAAIQRIGRKARWQAKDMQKACTYTSVIAKMLTSMIDSLESVPGPKP